MRNHEPFQHDDLTDLHQRLYGRATRVVPMRDIYKGDTNPYVIGLRHDVDDNPGSFDTALRMAEWEFNHGLSSTYYLLHDSHYWDEYMLARAPMLEELGHEVGIHVNALAEGMRQDKDPHRILARAVAELRSAGVRVTGCVAHGDQLCHKAHFVNDEIFTESPRPTYGERDRSLIHKHMQCQIQPVSRSVYGLEYDANWLDRRMYLSDSGGMWSTPFEEIVGRFALGDGQLHMLVHPDWWGQAFSSVWVAA